MDSRVNARSLMLVFIALALSGAAFYLSLGLNYLWWPIWLAALPILWMAPRLSWRGASASALAAECLGGLSMWSYYRRLQFPVWLRLEVLIVPAVAFALGVLLFRSFMRRGKPWLAALAFPAWMVGFEYLRSLGVGTFGATAYTQLKNVPVLQLGALTGLWGISFAVLLFAPMIVAALLSDKGSGRQVTIGLFLVYGCILGYGALRLSMTPQAPHAVVVGMVDSDLAKNIFPQDDASDMQLMRDYAQQVRALAQRGAQVVVLPEMTALVRDSVSTDIDKLFEETARSAKVQIVLGVLHVTSRAAFNEARLYSASGELEAVYRKHHLVPVVEGRTTPGNDVSILPQAAGTIGLEICRDMDYLDPARRYGKANAGLLLVPAWDFDVDRVWHGHIAVLRGIENGFTIVRAAKQGLLTVSDDRGRVLAETRTTPQESFTTLLTTVPVRHDATLYQSWGDWFAWLNLAALAGLLVTLVLGSRTPKQALHAPDSVLVHS